MSDDGIRVTAGAINVKEDNLKEWGGIAKKLLYLAMALQKLGIEVVQTFPAELKAFFETDPLKKRRYHWAHYMLWNMYAVALSIMIYGVFDTLFTDASILLFPKWLMFGGLLMIAGFLPKSVENACMKSGTILSWHPGLGWINKQGDWMPMPWPFFIKKFPFQLGAKTALVRHMQRNQKRHGATATPVVTPEVQKAAETAKPQPVERLPMPEYIPFAFGPANVGETVLRGTKIIDGYTYRNQQESKSPGGLDGGLVTFGAVPLAYEAEPQHLLITGKSGAGKTQEINAILRTARGWRGNASLVADPGGGYLARFANDGDSILNPFDSRSEDWSPFAEIQYDYDCAMIAKATIPTMDGSGGEWNHYAQTLLQEVLKAMWIKGEKNASRVLYYCATATADELAKLLDGTPAAAMTQKGNDRLLANVRGIISTYMGSWQYLRDGGSFSVRQFVRDSDTTGAFLFMPYTPTQKPMLKFLISTWMELAILEGLSLSESYTRRLWLILDELDSLGKISSLKDGLTMLRKYGVCCVCGIQTVAQLRNTYGKDEAQTLLSCMATKLLLSPGDPETADYFSRVIGDQEIERLQISSGTSKKKDEWAFEGGESKNEHLHRQTQPAVMPSQLSALPNLHGYLCMPGTDVFQVVIPYVKMPDLNSPFDPAQKARSVFDTPTDTPAS